MADERLSHIDADGTARMVDVGTKDTTRRVARARAVVYVNAEVMRQLSAAALPKGDALNTAKIAGIQGAKRTSDLIPLCHPLSLSYVDVTFDVDAGDEHGGTITITAEARTDGKTGVEMEALTAASVAALTFYDMVKAVQKDVRITDVRLIEKQGGKSGHFLSEG